MRRRQPAGALVLALLLGTQDALGQEAPAGALRDDVGVQVEVARPTVDEPVPSSGVDERALRFYAAQYDYARVDEEIARLKALHPEWEPPRDLFGGAGRAAPEVDVSGLWAAYDRGDFPAVRREIEALRRINPAWRPPAKLMELMQAAETRTELKQAVDAGDWPAAVAAGEASSGVISPAPEYIENLWLLAEAYHRHGASEQAYALYRRAWDDGSVEADLRLSTLQKALANPDPTRLRELFALEEERARNDGQNERFAQIRKDWAGGGDGAGGGPPSEASRLGMMLPKLSAGEVDAAQLAWARQAAEAHRHADAAQVLGWHEFGEENWPEAESWFRRSLSWRSSPEAAEGLARVLMEQRRFDEAGEVARTWADRAPKVNDVLAELERQRAWGALQGSDPRRRLQATRAMLAGGAPADPGILVAHGWALYQLDRPSEAVQAFEQALAAQEGGAESRGDAVYGLVHAYASTGFTAEARALISDAALSAEQRQRLEQVVTEREALDAYHAGRHEDSLQLVRSLRQNAPENGALAALEAWNLLELGALSEARALFAELHQSYPSPEARLGMRAVDGRLYPER